MADPITPAQLADHLRYLAELRAALADATAALTAVQDQLNTQAARTAALAKLDRFARPDTES